MSDVEIKSRIALFDGYVWSKPDHQVLSVKGSKATLLFVEALLSTNRNEPLLVVFNPQLRFFMDYKYVRGRMSS